MTEQLFRDDSYLQSCDATVTAAADGAIELDRTVFYPMGGGQPGDTGTIEWDGGSATVVDTRYGEGGAIRHIVGEDAELPAVGTAVTAVLDWDRRYLHMRMHTALHLLSAGDGIFIHPAVEIHPHALTKFRLEPCQFDHLRIG